MMVGRRAMIGGVALAGWLWTAAPAAAQPKPGGSLSPPGRPRAPSLSHRCEVSKVRADSRLGRGVARVYAQHRVARALGDSGCAGFYGRVRFSFSIATSGAVEAIAVRGRAEGRACVRAALAGFSFRPRPAPTSIAGTARFGPMFDSFPAAPCAIRGPVPRARLVGVKVRGGLRAAQVRRWFRKRDAGLVDCYRAAVFDRPALAGVVRIELAVDERGKPVRWAVDGPEPLETCARKALPGLRLPRSRTGQPATVEARVRFDIGP